MGGNLLEILTCSMAGEELSNKNEVMLVAGKGIEGDRYFRHQGTFSEQLMEAGDFEVTLIESEEIDRFNELTGLHYSPDRFRRNLVTAGVKLNSLVGKEFSLGEARLIGVRLCEPCAYLADLLGNEVMQHMVHKAGLRATIKLGARVSVGSTLALF